MKLTSAEWQVMNALWRGYPATAQDIAERLEGETTWAYTTIKTMLSRLVKKGAVSARKRANVSIYQPLLTRRKARMRALGALLEDAFEGAVGPLVHFLVEEEKLSPAERQRLLAALKEKSKT